MYQKKILLVDDEEAILNLLETILRKENFKNIYTASNGNEAIKICDKIQPDIIVLDIMLPDMTGHDICKKIRTNSMIPIIFLSAKSEELDRVMSFAIGGDDFISKPFSPREVVARITSILNREAYYQNVYNVKTKNQTISFGNCILDIDKREVSKNGFYIDLTAKEYLLLEYLIENRNKTISKQQILDKVWGCDFEGYENTVMVHIRKIREKVEDNPSQPIFIKTIKGRGYRFELEERSI